MIPNLIHVIWAGLHDPADALINSWADKHFNRSHPDKEGCGIDVKKRPEITLRPFERSDFKRLIS